MIYIRNNKNILLVDQHFDAIMCQLEPYSKSCQVKFIPTSISYESHSYLNSLKSNVRINFSHSYSFEVGIEKYGLLIIIICPLKLLKL